MKYQGRIVILSIAFAINTYQIIYYCLRDGYVSNMEYLSLPIILPLSWWLGHQYDRVKFYSEKDPLTGLYNRRYLDNRFNKMKASAVRNGKTISILFIDVNNFKAINDNWGHIEGDRLIKVLATQLKSSVSDKDIVARWGGDEFIILSLSCKEGTTNEIIQHIHDNLKVTAAKRPEISVSIGTAAYPSDGTSLEQLLRVADTSMYNMKVYQSG
ncbi:GGDEF domain-containing protein [Neobacillus dielmonensis]|uniref:GGDEF domain-containing protein n=1 Tax=Neobacillus dielmonensis TaxID=1347369 RepID=UPI0005AB0EB8|nr:GGDEF domain-containing protein [Neobacillus dielmonensis]